MEIGDKLICFLIAFFLLLLVVSLYEQNYPRALYWLASALINYAVLLMGG